MYKERRDTISIKFYVLIALVILIIVFAIILFIPRKKSEVKEPVEMELYSKQSMIELKNNHNKTFYENFKELKRVSEKYFIKKVDALLDKQTITLDKLYDNHLITTITDENGEKCDSEKSGVDVVKNTNNNNYKMTITLVCGEDTASVATYMGTYDYCEDNDYCEKQVEVKEKADEEVKKEEEPKQEEQVEQPSENPILEQPDETTNLPTMFEYVLSPNDDNGNWTNWSDWGLEQKQASLYQEIDTKTETKKTDYDCSTSTTQTYIAGYKEEQYLVGYTTKTTKVGTKTVNGRVEAQYDTKTVPVYGVRKVPIYKTRTVNNSKTCTKDEATIFYRYRTFSYKTGINYVKYSSSDNDQYLINKGYVKTGKTK